MNGSVCDILIQQPSHFVHVNARSSGSTLNLSCTYINNPPCRQHWFPLCNSL